MTGGGWSKRGMGIPLAQRVRAGTSTHAALEPPSPAKHCWVADAVDGYGVKRPGLLVEWRQADAGWEGRVVYSARMRPADRDGETGHEWLVVEEWLPADLLTPL